MNILAGVLLTVSIAILYIDAWCADKEETRMKKDISKLAEEVDNISRRS